MSTRPNSNGGLNPARSLMKEGEVARWLNMSVKTLQGWRLKGEGPEFEKLGRSVRYSVASVEAWINTRSRSSTSAASPAAPCCIQGNDPHPDTHQGDQS